MTLLNIPDKHVLERSDDKITYDFDLTIFTSPDKVRFAAGGISTSWMNPDEGFIKRISFENLNPCFRKDHLVKEIEIKNTLDEAASLLNNGKYVKAIEKLDDAIYYDSNYGEAIFYKSKALFGQKHFVKSLRHYKKAVRIDHGLEDVDYHRLLLSKSSEERDAFPKIKQNIYAGDEYFAKGDYKKAVDCYTRALANPSRFKDKIHYKLLNKKAVALLKLDQFHNACECFSKSVDVSANDCAYFGLAVSLYRTNDDRCNQKIKQSLDNAVEISQRQLLRKALILRDIGEIEDSLECIDELLAVHYRVDDDYLKALNLKLDVLKALDENVCEVEKIIGNV